MMRYLFQTHYEEVKDPLSGHDGRGIIFGLVKLKSQCS